MSDGEASGGETGRSGANGIPLCPPIREDKSDFAPSSTSDSLHDDIEVPHVEDVSCLEDPWSLVRVAMGSLAGVSWRLKQALVWPMEAFELYKDPWDAAWSQRFKSTQTYDDFRQSMAFRPNSLKGVIDIVVCDDMIKLREKVNLDAVTDHLQAFLGFNVVIKPQAIPLDEWAYPRPGPTESKQIQYGAHFVIARLRSSTDPRSVCTVGLTGLDLYPPRAYEFVTGISDGAQRVGVYSFARYMHRSEDGGLAELKVKRTVCLIMTLCRESLKLCGFGECRLLQCLMNPFPGGPPEGVRILPLRLCCICLRKLQWLTQKDMLDRYARLHAVLAEWFPDETVWIWERMRQIGLPTYASLRDVGPS
eukprot:TRINITY_DN28618_c0_g1_i1.p1 TRINITY_DN28618_c0_g1~~TRINITY_DN28618_c0_g1_i1.p1  ORF type:complete len:405 (-),score=37.26 TRINITY_DN28618_c0_g1_i1:22-1110(-)